MGAGAFFDPEFQQVVEWDSDIVTGYSHEFLQSLGSDVPVNWFRPFNYGLGRRVFKGEFDAIWIHGYARLYNLYIAIIARLAGVPVLIRDDSTLLSRPRSKVKRSIKVLFFKLLNSTCQIFLSVGTKNTDYFERYGIPESKIALLPYAVDVESFYKRAQLSNEEKLQVRQSIGIQDSKPIFIFIGKLIPQKVPLDLLDAFASLARDKEATPGAHLVFIGDGPLRTSLETRIAEYGLLEYVHILGFVTQMKLPRYMAVSKALVLPSQYETWGLIINETMCCETLVIVGNRAGCSNDLVVHEKTGLVFESGNIVDLAENLTRVLSNEEEASRIAKGGYQKVQKLTYEDSVLRLASVVQDLKQAE